MIQVTYYAKFYIQVLNKVNQISEIMITERERLAQLERERAETPVKPTYSPEELEKLVSFIMRMTTLYDLRDEDWTDEARQGIEDWLMEPRALILSVYFRGEVLKATSDIPITPVYDLTYFIRQPDYIFKVILFIYLIAVHINTRYPIYFKSLITLTDWKRFRGSEHVADSQRFHRHQGYGDATHSESI